MAGNSFGKLFRVTTFGESHGTAIGGVIDGCPAGVVVDLAFVQRELARRKPGQSEITTTRQEGDIVEFISGILMGKSTGAPIAFIIQNEDGRSKDYEHLKEAFRPGHADYTYHQKYGLRDYRGGGRSSARETVCRVVAGAVAKQVLAGSGIVIQAYVSQVHDVVLEKPYSALDLDKTEENMVRCPDPETAERMITCIRKVQEEGDTVGGIVSCVIKGVPVGLGDPVFDKLHADLGKAILSINAVKGFELGSGFGSVSLKGSVHNDEFVSADKKIQTKSNNAGGILGGISNGEDIYFRAVFKPVSTLIREQKTVDLEGNEITIAGKGRHDPCVVPRAVPIVEAMAAITLADHLLRNRSAKI